MTGDRKLESRAGRIGWAIGLGAAVAAVVARRRLRQGAATVARVAADTLETSSVLVERSVRSAGRVALLPADATLAVARERVLAGLPEAADTKWRAAQLVLRASVVNGVARGAEPGVDLDVAGAVFANATRPEGVWDDVTLGEALRRVTHTLDLEGSITRDGTTIEVVTTHCPLIDGAPEDERPGICDAVCGESQSLLHGIAQIAEASWESVEQMGRGADRCVRRATRTA